MTGEASRSLEIELTFDVAADTPLPDLGRVPGVVAVGTVEVRDLDARYFDAAGFALGRAGYAVRRRTGGPDEGWHLKGPKGADGGRVETHWPLGAADRVPDAVESAVNDVMPAAGDLAPIARIRNERHAYVLQDAAGGAIAEFVDDHVTATDETRSVVTTWREWEFELGPAAPVDPAERAALFDAVAEAVARVGGHPAASDSKLARTLGV